MLDLFVRETNRYAEQCIASKAGDIAPNSMFALWKPVTRLEMRVFLAISITMGLIWKPDFKSYRCTAHPSIQTPWFNKCMTRDRFLAILGFFHVDKLYKIRPVLEQIGDRFAAAFYPGRDLSVDESMVPWIERLSFRMYIPSKPTRYGIKMYCVCDAATGYVCKMEVYTGAGPEDLKDRGTRAVGTVRTGREGIPEEMHPKNIKLQKNESIFRRKGDLLCLRLKDKKDVFFLSTVHTTEKERVGNDRQGNVRLKIKLVNDYNKKMKGVDQFDQNVSYYSFYRKTVKWWKRTVFHLLHLAKLQSYLLYKMNAENPKSQYQFTLERMEQLSEEIPRLQNPLPGLPVDAERLSGKGRGHYPTKIPSTEKKRAPQRLCACCSFRDPSNEKRYLHRKDTTFECTKCRVGLCIQPCFQIFHERTDYKTAVKEALGLEFN
ncbi:hypothetical protein BaRGS_00030767 [Batillaria attramentaria]|uniref:PiggyBac transposable element-derived protein domain-containing protein n=1 Tax=Batillaria attramentaria TaxID=370345 RepID=A0ABD0JSM9_9CAEN